MSLLISSGANINHENSNKETPIFMACQNGHKEIVELLISSVLLKIRSQNVGGLCFW